MGNVVALTNESGAVEQRYDYDSFGNLEQSALTIQQPYTYNGREWDSETGLYYYRARYYDPKVGRFISKDPIGFRGGINLYRYVGNNPVNWIDPWGFEAEVGVRPFYPIPIPYARHCFIRFNQNNSDTLSFDNKGVHPDPNSGGADYSRTKGPENDKCVKKEMKKCKGEDYDFTDFNCCHCVSNALNDCGLRKEGPWPNFPYDASNPPYSPKSNPKP